MSELQSVNGRCYYLQRLLYSQTCPNPVGPRRSFGFPSVEFLVLQCLSIHAYVFMFTRTSNIALLTLTPQPLKMIIIFFRFNSFPLIYIFIFDIVNIICAYMYKMTFGIVANGVACTARVRDECRYFHTLIHCLQTCKFV